MSKALLLLKKLSSTLSFICLSFFVHIYHGKFFFLLSLFLLLFHSFSRLNNRLIFLTQWMSYLAFIQFTIKHLLFKKFMILENLLVLLSFLIKLLLFLEELFKLCIFKIRSDNFIIKETNLCVVLMNIFLQDVHLLINNFKWTFTKKLRVFRSELSRKFLVF